MVRQTTRREALKLATMGLAAGGLVACGGRGDLTPKTLPLESERFAGARLKALMRPPFVPTSMDVSREQAAAWSVRRDAEIELLFRDDWRERTMAVARQASGEDIAELYGNAPHLIAPQLVDVSDLAEETGERLGGWMDLVRETAVVDGVWRAIPWSYTAQAINYRQDLLDEVGAVVPTTYDELLDASVRLHDAGLPQAGFTMNRLGPNDSGNFAYSLLWSFGGAEVDETGTRVALDSAATRDALAYYVELFRVSNPMAHRFSERGNNEAFLDGSVAMTQNATSIYWKAMIDAPEIADAMNHVRFPTGPAGNHQLVQLNSLGIFSHSPNVAAARSWLRSVTEAEHLSRRASETLSFFLPPLLGFEDDPSMPWHTDPKLAELRIDSGSGHLTGWPGPASQESGLVYDNQTIVRMFVSAGSGDVSINEAVSVATEDLRRVYET